MCSRAVQMFRCWPGFLVGAVLAGCTSVSTYYPIISPYQGVHIDLFFLEWGAPVSSQPLDYGGEIYLWFGGRDSAYKPGHVDTELIGNTAWWQSYRIKNYDPRLECGARIVTNPDGTIREILIHESSKAWWEVPLCRKIFGPPVR